MFAGSVMRVNQCPFLPFCLEALADDVAGMSACTANGKGE